MKNKNKYNDVEFNNFDKLERKSLSLRESKSFIYLRNV